MPSKQSLAVGCFLAWTLFVWGGRIRNAFADDSLAGQGLVGPVLLSASFALPALLLGVGWLVRARSGRPAGRWATVLGPGTKLLAVWTVVVWAVRATDIAVLGGHSVAFVLVHLALAAVSMALAVMAWRSITVSRSRPRPRSGAGVTHIHESRST
jgi:hypothetical protein